MFGRRDFQAQVRPFTAVGETHQPFNHRLLFHGRFVREETHVLFGNVKVYHFSRAVVRYLTQESRQFRHFDIGAETLFALDCACNIQFVVGRFLSEYCRPCVKATYTLLGKFLGAQVFEKHI